METRCQPGVLRVCRSRQDDVERLLTQDVLFLAPGLDGTGPCIAHPPDGHGRILAEFDQQACRHQSRAPQSAATMDDDALAERQPFAQLRAGFGPGALPGAARHAAIDDGQDEMFDADRHRFLHPGDTEVLELVRLDQAQQRGGAPGGDCGEVRVEIAIPVAGQGAVDLLAWAKGHADHATEGVRLDGIDAQGVGLAGFFHAGSFFI